MKQQRWCYRHILGVVFLIAMMTIATQAAADEPPRWRQAEIDFDSDEEVVNVAFSDNFAYVTLFEEQEYQRRLAVLDITNPIQTREIGAAEIGVVVMAINGDYLYGSIGYLLRIVDISNPELPVLISETDVETSNPKVISYYDNHVYIPDYTGIRIIDVSDPYHPHEASYMNEGIGTVYGITIAQDPTGESDRVFAYLVGDKDNYTGEGGGLNILDVTDPANPILMNSNCGFPCHISRRGIYDIVLEGHYVYLPMAHNAAMDGWGLHIVDVSDASWPVEVDTYLTPGIEQFNLTLIGDQLNMLGKRYEGSGEQLMSTIDVAVRGMLHQTGQRDMAFRKGSAQIESHQGCLFIPQGEAGLKILCESNVTPTPPKVTFLPLLSWFGE